MSHKHELAIDIRTTTRYGNNPGKSTSEGKVTIRQVLGLSGHLSAAYLVPLVPVVG